MKILALEPYYGGSHKAFLDGWSKLSEHQWTILSLPAYKWKWRMRHAAITFAEQVNELVESGKSWDLIFCSDMLNLAEFSGLVSPAISKLPSVVYFHENQLTYPVQVEDERDYQFAMTNITTALAAKSVWFNSSYHRDSFVKAIGDFFKKMPDHQPTDAVTNILKKSKIILPGINRIKNKNGDRKNDILSILWAARWEHDKNPEDFFEALKILKNKEVKFRINVIGQCFREIPPVFSWAKEYFAEEIDTWGYQEDRTEYEKVLAESDVIVSTADHEFFGISVLEAISAGAYPVLPNRLSYPEILGLNEDKKAEEYFYNGSVEELVDKLIDLAEQFQRTTNLKDIKKLSMIVERFMWDNVASILDDAIENIYNNAGQFFYEYRTYT